MGITPALLSDDPASSPQRWSSGIASLDGALAGGLMHGRMHEVYAAETGDGASATGFVAALTIAMGEQTREIMWVRTSRSARRGGIMQANGWAEMGGKPGQILFAMAPDNMALLRITVDALRCAALNAVVMESHGAMSELDLTASRRLALAAEKSGVTAFVLRIDAPARSSAAQTRWQIASAPSRALPGNAPGHPTFDMELLRQRAGPSGLRWQLEWDRGQRIFRDATLSGAMVPLPLSEPDTGTRAAPLRALSRHAA